MRIEIVTVLDGGRVDFRCGLGRAYGQWAGPTLPGPGQLLDVELDVEEPIAAWARAIAGPGAITGTPASGAVLTGTVLGAGDADDPVVDLRLGDDIVLLEPPVDGWDVSPGDVVAVRVASLRLYPYEL
ncbi:hypothetical protein AB0C76_31870 [Kitasatospora sp. NPDC048722]|uniref:hypothetical protein n=1 Tax=Kitasatospora sp. NPDC048722 TaxID=3155639 RepID=UPI0033E7635F